MNFYIGFSIEDVNINDYNVELDNSLIDFINCRRNEWNMNMDVWYNIDPYDDVVIENCNLTNLLKIFNTVLESDALNKCDNSNSLSESLIQLIELTKKAIRENKNLISIGD